MKSLERWKRCVVNVEFGYCSSDTEDRQSGTAIFVIYKGRYFLVTAAHLLIDKKVGSEKQLYNQMFGMLLRVPLLDELYDKQKKKLIEKHLFLKEDGELYSEYVPDGVSYTHEGDNIAAPKRIQLSESLDPEDCAVSILKDLDLAVISLRIRIMEYVDKILPPGEQTFTEELLQLGYQPITISEIGEEPSQEGADIFTVGYPAHVSQVDKRSEIIGKYEIAFSSDVTLQCFTFGKVSLLSAHIPYFWGDLRIYIGNSGCPVFENEKLVGIVTHDAVIEEVNRLNNVPFAKATKAKFIQQLLDEQMIKDDAFVDPKNLHTRFPTFFKSPEEIQKEREYAIKHKPKNAKIIFRPEMKDYLMAEKK